MLYIVTFWAFWLGTAALCAQQLGKEKPRCK